MEEQQIKKARSQNEHDDLENLIVHLPQELTIDIFCRLPITSVVQFCLTSCSSLALSRNRDLVNSHLSNSSQKMPCFILHSDYPMKNQLHLFDFSDEKVRKLDIPFASSMPEFRIAGSCNGILCLVNSLFPDSIYLFNPFAIGEKFANNNYREIPKNSTFKQQPVVHGFGFDSLNNDYKVIIIGDKAGRHNNVENGQVSNVQIYSVIENRWRNGGVIPYRLEKVKSFPGVCVNGKLHWPSQYLRHKGRLSDRVIVSYDLSDDSFDVITKPSTAAKWVHCHLSVFEGCISACTAERTGYGTVHLWVMNEYGVNNSWVNKYQIKGYIPAYMMNERVDKYHPIWRNLFRRKKSIRLLCVKENGELVMEYSGVGLVSYDPATRSFIPLRFEGIPEIFEATVHVCSLKSAINPF